MSIARTPSSSNKLVFILVVLVALSLGVIVGYFTGILPTPTGQQSPEVEIRTDAGDDGTLELTLISATNVEYLVVTDENGTLARTPTGDPVVFSRADQQAGAVRQVDLNSIERGQLVVRSRPRPPHTTPTASVGSGDRRPQLENWQVVASVRVAR